MLSFGMVSRILRFPVMHWRGEVGFWPTLAITVVGLRLFINLLGGIPFLALDVAVFVWQAVGGARSMHRAQRNTPDLLSAVAGHAALLACALLLLWPHLDRMTRNVSPVATIAGGPATDPNAVRVSGRDVTLTGTLEFGMFNELKAALETPNTIARVVLDSDGGRVYAARALARLVEDHELETHVDDTCASACTLVFAAGIRRSMGATARLGFHGYAELGNVPVLDIASEENRDRQTFLAAGVAPEFVTRIFETDPRQMWFPSREQLEAAGFLTGG